MKEQQIGLVTILRDRYYDDVLVPAGTYPVLKAGSEIFWRMDGYPATQEETKIERLGDGLFGIWPGGDMVTSAVAVKHESKRFSASQFSALLELPLCQPGEEQRLSFSLSEDYHG